MYRITLREPVRTAIKVEKSLISDSKTTFDFPNVSLNYHASMIIFKNSMCDTDILAAFPISNILGIVKLPEISENELVDIGNELRKVEDESGSDQNYGYHDNDHKSNDELG